MASGETIHIISTDAHSTRDFTIFARQLGHTLVQSIEAEGKFHFILRKA